MTDANKFPSDDLLNRLIAEAQATTFGLLPQFRIVLDRLEHLDWPKNEHIIRDFLQRHVQDNVDRMSINDMHSAVDALADAPALGGGA